MPTTTLKWIKVVRGFTPFLRQILFTDGKELFVGWLETVQPEEDLQFYDAVNETWPDDVIYWCELPDISEPE